MVERAVNQRFQGAASGVMLDGRRLQREARAGFWPHKVLTDYFDKTLGERSGDLALLAYRKDPGTAQGFTYAELNERVNRIAANLIRLGVLPGDVVSFQLPNWWEFIAVFLACIRIGAVSNPLMPIFRSRELEFMVGRAEAKILIVPRVFRNFDHEALALDLQQKLPMLEKVIVVGGEDENAFADVLSADHGGTFDPANTLMQPDDIMKLMYTSGTTGEPKGVMHSSNTLLTSVEHVAHRLGLGSTDVILVSSPFAHSFGFVYGIMMSVYLGTPLITMDVWDPETAIAIMERHAVSFTFGAPSFLSDLINVPGVNQRQLDSFRLFLASGAPIPQALVDQAGKTLKAQVATAFGMTELGIVSATRPEHREEGGKTDGFNLPFCELRVIGADQQELPAGMEGSLQWRSSTAFLGYFRRPDLYNVDEDGWFDTGDLAIKYANGYIRIVGRLKDIIIRGGENIPVVELEKLIYEMPQVNDVALVSMPDPRLGEKVCAFVTLHQGQHLTLRNVTDFLESRNLARQYLPERLEIVDEMPRTPAGKVQKYILREITAKFAECNQVSVSF
jgi:cyclohexanecarboxylate-CoA ligase